MKKLLLIDDDASVRELWKHWHDKMELTFRGKNPLETTTDLEKADALIAENEYDVIILDLGLPPGGYEETVKWIQRRSKEKDFPPIVVLTGNEDVMMRQKCIVAGAAHFFTKFDAQNFPNLFFKILYDVFLRYYGTKVEASNSPPAE